MGAFIDLTGQTFGRLTVIERVEDRIDASGRRKAMWSCACQCGNTVQVHSGNLRSGNTKGCGCTRTEATRAANATHGMSRTTTYHIWRTMMARCANPKNNKFKIYGGREDRPVRVCERWLKFENFLEDMGARPEGKSLDRYPDPCGDYRPQNCRWATYREQKQNQRKAAA
jgi:hypothetical protein